MPLLVNEKFDFDVSMSPASSTDDENEVFVDQVSHIEGSVSANIASQLEDGVGGVRVSWSPLTGDHLEAICEEAHRLANHLQSSEPSPAHCDDDETADVTSNPTTESEQFVQDTEVKLGMIGQAANVLSPVKRQTFCVQDSPMKQLPPAIQHSLQRGIISNTVSSTSPATKSASSTRPATKPASSTRPATNAGASSRLATNSTSSIYPATKAPSSTCPATKAPSSSRPAPNTPSSIRPATNSTSSIRPATDTPSSSRPATDTPSSSRPATNSTSSIRPATNLTSSIRPAINTPSSSRPAIKAPSSTRPATKAPSTRPASTARLSTSSPVAKHGTMLRGKAVPGFGVTLPSKPAAPSTYCSANKSRVEKTRLQPPSKAATGWSRSPNSRPSSRAGSYEDLLSDTASVASDISDSSLNSSMQGKRTLAPPTKVRHLFSVFCLLSGKLNSSMSLSASTVPAPSSIRKPANQSRPQRSNVCATAEPASSIAGRRSLSNQARKLSTPLKRAEATPLQLTPNNKRVSEKNTSIPAAASARLQSGLKAKPKPQALVPSTPSGIARGVRHGDDVSKMLKPKRMMSASTVESVSQKPSAGPQTLSAGGCRSLQMKARRPSALPTPLRSRTPAIHTTTPTNQLCPVRPPLTPDPDHSSPRTVSNCSPVSWDIQEAEPVDAPDIQPFCLEEEEEETPAAPPSTAPHLDHSESTDIGALSHGESEPTRNPETQQLETVEESNSKTQEVLLFDLPAPTLQPPEKLLIDLTSTPNLIRSSNNSCTTTQYEHEENLFTDCWFTDRFEEL
ncbi:mucin-2-like [Scomber scombrus]|uniref:mucin-2-like n=1 Tax=Scomber scombrus TaxID=13677 RepID=UPI002DDB19D6|nr:mucin-2-like [Scomber scombrus]